MTGTSHEWELLEGPHLLGVQYGRKLAFGGVLLRGSGLGDRVDEFGRRWTVHRSQVAEYRYHT
jgi:hypothetical protein